VNADRREARQSVLGSCYPQGAVSGSHEATAMWLVFPIAVYGVTGLVGEVSRWIAVTRRAHELGHLLERLYDSNNKSLLSCVRQREIA